MTVRSATGFPDIGTSCLQDRWNAGQRLGKIRTRVGTSGTVLAVELHVQGVARRNRPILARRHAAELAEIARQVRLIVIAVLAREIRPRNLTAARHPFHDAAQTIDATVEL